MSPSNQTQRRPSVIVIVGGGFLAVVFVLSAIAKLIEKPAVPYSVVVASAHAPTAIASAESTPAPLDECLPQAAAQAMLRERLTGAQCMGVMLTTLRAANGEAAIRTLGWRAERSDDGAPCVATYHYEQHEARRMVRFHYVPGSPGRLISSDNEAGQVADLCDAYAAGIDAADSIPTEAQQNVALMFRMSLRRFAGDAYMHPREPGTLVFRRPHCVAGNADMRIAGAPVVQLLRRARITKVRCVGDATWELAIPARGALGSPVLVE